MWQEANDGLTYLRSQGGESLFFLFWFVILFEVPRYTLAFISVASLAFRRPDPTLEERVGARVTVVIAGHNEQDSIERCIASLHEQSRVPDEIIVVSDGSTDRMPEKLRELRGRGLIHQAHCTQMRAGKSAAVNLAVGRASGDFIVNVDCDCTFERDSIREIMRPFSRPEIGAVAGNIVVRNAQESLISTFQAIEYLISISLGKQAANLTQQVTCISGAFGAFRRTAIERVGGLDSGGGEDLDVTLRMRALGWKMHFAPDAICYTDAPATLLALTRQRFRWERDAIRLRYRKHRDLMNPFRRRFDVLELAHQIDFLAFHIAAAIAFPIYVAWLFLVYADLAPIVLVGAQLGMLALDAVTFLLAAMLCPKVKSWVLAPYLVGYSLFYGLFMRFVRLAAYMQEWVFDASYRDSYVPAKVHLVRR